MTSPLFMQSLRKVVIDYLSTHEYIEDFDGAVRVAPNLNGYTGSENWVTVSYGPGSRVVHDRLDARSVQIEAYAPSLDGADNLCERALAAVLSMRGLVADSLVVTATEVGTTPFDLTDQLNGRYRYVCDVTVYVRPN